MEGVLLFGVLTSGCFFFFIVYKVLWELILSELMKIRITGSFGGSELRRKVLMISWAVKSAINKMKQ